jgi:hypothetical protein
MNNYLYKHYKGKYRVLADYDIETNDFPRDEQGNIDEDFNDFYIPGKKNVQIRHAGNNKLGCYVFSTTLGRNILASIYERELNKNPPKKINTLADELIKENIITEITYYDGEILFIFPASYLEQWHDIFKLKKTGANISPLSSKNLPKSQYVINKKDEEEYNTLLKDLNKQQKLLITKRATNNITSKFTKKQKAEMRQLCIKPKQYIHYIGKWDKLLNEIRKEMKNV